MSESENEPPEVNLPQPDEFDSGDLTSGKKQKKSRKQRKHERLHPKDQYVDVRRKAKPSCILGAGCSFVLIAVAVVLFIGYLLVDPAIMGSRVLQLKNPEEVISEAPTEATIYWAPKSRIIYEAPATDVPIGIYAKQVEVSGIFSENVVLRGAKVTCKEGTLFQKNLSSKTLKFTDEGMTVEGDLKSQDF